MRPLGDTTTGAIRYALHGLDVRSKVRAHNLANVNTPGFQAQTVDFESTLRDALRRSRVDRADLEPSITPSMALPSSQGNTVDLEGEIVGQMKDNLQRDALIASFNVKANALRTAIGGR